MSCIVNGSGVFKVRRTPECETPGQPRLYSINLLGHVEDHLTKGDLEYMRREINRALKEER